MKRIITVLTAILLVSAMLMSLTACGSSDSSDETEVFSTEAAVYTESATPVANTSEEVLNYFNTLVNGLKESKPELSYRYEMNVPDDSIKITAKGSEEAEEIPAEFDAINGAAAGLKDMMLEDIKEVSGNVAKGEDNSEFLYVKGESWVSALTVADIDYATIKEVGDTYYITIAFNDVEAGGDTSSLAKAFELRDKDVVLASEELAKTSAYLKLNDYSVGYSGCKITATVNRLTDEITNIHYFMSANVVADMTGTGTYTDLKDDNVLFTLEDRANFDIKWESELPTSPLETTTEATTVAAAADQATAPAVAPEETPVEAPATPAV